MWEPLLSRYQSGYGEQIASGNCYQNWLGIQTDRNLFPTVDFQDIDTFRRVPYADDGVYGSSSEYAAIILALEMRANKFSFSVVELGAGWGPWISAGGVLAKREGVEEITLVGVEADEGRCEAMESHLRRNKLWSDDGIHSSVKHGAAWDEDKTVYFGVSDPMADHGSAASAQMSDSDYRGRTITRVAVPAMTIETICAGMESIDCMHWDIQGSEYDVAVSSLEFLNQHARVIFVGTHSLKIHGSVVELFAENGWEIVYQNPPTFKYKPGAASFMDMHTTDGELVVINRNLIKHQKYDRVFSAGEMATQTAVSAEGLKVSNRQRGFVAYGPYQRVPPGDYRVTFRYSSDAGTEEIIGWVDFTACSPEAAFSLAKTEVFGTNGKVNEVGVDATISDYGVAFEGRLFSEGTSTVTLLSVHLLEQEDAMVEAASKKD
jgi:hypothetical protein